jgi:epoxyqueuosine reductase
MSIETIVRGTISDPNYIFGFSSLKGLLNKKFSGYNYGITIGRKLDDVIIDQLNEGPTKDYYLHYLQINSELQEIGKKLSDKLTVMNIKNILIKPTVSDEEYDAAIENNMTHEFSHKMAATRAGLGWIGKTDLFISKKFGPRIRMTTIITSKPINISGKTIDESKCGNCRICVDACPAGAANGRLWNINVKRDEFYDARKCRNKCRELANKNISKDISICGICVSVCPIGKK